MNKPQLTPIQAEILNFWRHTVAQNLKRKQSKSDTKKEAKYLTQIGAANENEMMFAACTT